MGSLVSSRPAVALRLLVGVLLAPVFMGAGPAPVHAMVPAIASDARFAVLADALAAGQTSFPCQSAPSASPCYGPDQIRAAYNVQPVLDRGITGAGTKIVIIAAFQDPKITTDLSLFDTFWGLAPAKLDITAPDGLTPFDPTSAVQVGWAVEIATDVEWAHVIAPGSGIHLVLAKSGNDEDLLSATKYAVRHRLGDVISQSFGEAETCPDARFLAREHAVFEEARARGMALFAASGDFGAAERTCDGSLVRGPATPASDPDVIAVGGTRLVADPVSGAYQSEVGWSDQFGASGGGFSGIYRRPGYQATAVPGHRRGLPDVAWSADNFGGIIVAVNGKFTKVWGTSTGTPQWAGIAALADEASRHRVHDLQTSLYHLARTKSGRAAFHDITSGNNTFGGFEGFSAVAGWDAMTGLGSPNVSALLPLLSHDGEHD